MIDILYARSEYRKNRKVDNKSGFVFVDLLMIVNMYIDIE